MKKRLLKKKRAMRVRKHLRGTAVRPRLCIVKSNRHIEVQIIDDEQGKTLASLSTKAKEFRDTQCCKRSREAAKKLGERIAELSREKNVKEVVCDRGPFKYHGILQELADAARGNGLKF